MAHPAHTNTSPYFFHHLPLSFAPIPMPASIALPPDPAPPMTLYHHEPLLDFDLSFSPAVTPDLLPANAYLLEPLDLLEPPMPAAFSPSSSTLSPSSAAAKPARPRLRNFQCTHPGCGKSFADNAHLKDHMFVHTGEKSLQCPECDKCFARVASLRSHRRVHTGERPFLCAEPDCDKQYASRAALRMHASLHAAAAKKKLPKKASTSSASSASAKPSTIKPQKTPTSTHTTHGHDANCDDCSDSRCRQLADKIKEQRQVILDLQAQLQSQAGSSPEKKRVQPKPPPAATSKEPVVKSPPLVPMVAPLYLLQDGIKPFKCMLGCGRVFSNYFQLAFHAKQHPEADAADVLGDQLPFPVGPKYCPVKGCEFSEESGKSMKTLQIVKRHWQRVHQNTRPFLCPDCPSHAQKAFKTRDNLTAHRKECKKRDSKASPSKRAASPLSSPKKRLKPSPSSSTAVPLL